MSNAMVPKSAAEASQSRSTPVFVSTTLLRATGRENKYCADPRLNSPATAVDPKMMATMTTAWYKFFACQLDQRYVSICNRSGGSSSFKNCGSRVSFNSSPNTPPNSS